MTSCGYLTPELFILFYELPHPPYLSLGNSQMALQGPIVPAHFIEKQVKSYSLGEEANQDP